MDLNEAKRLLRDYLKTNKDLSMLCTGAGSFMNCYNPNTHRIHGKVDTLGANTGRMTHNSPNMTQLSKDQFMRELICVPEGKLFVDVDASALELVMLGHYLGKYDDYYYAKVVEHGDKAKGTDVHTVNQRTAGLETRDAAKTFIYATLYGAGMTKLGHMLYKGQEFDYTSDEYAIASDSISSRSKEINGKLYYPVNKTQYAPVDDELIKATIYATKLTSRFKSGTKGYNDLVEDSTAKAMADNLYGLDSRKLYCRSPHSALNLLLQSAGAIYMKYLLVHIDNILRDKYKYDKDFAYILNVHDALSFEIRPEIKDEFGSILEQSFIDTSYELGLKYPVHGEPKFGKNQWETH